ncbi:hypothetical protein T492DRAFT_876969 [Pavlovales sp. CCMP2436]|nr:hypothetical protein T492DRAFT_876969 [Pavlovales sp. CCMP2436]
MQSSEPDMAPLTTLSLATQQREPHSYSLYRVKHPGQVTNVDFLSASNLDVLWAADNNKVGYKHCAVFVDRYSSHRVVLFCKSRDDGASGAVLSLNDAGAVNRRGASGEGLNPREIKPFVHEVAEDAATIYWRLNFVLAGPDGAPLVYTDLVMSMVLSVATNLAQRLSNAVMRHVLKLFDAEEAPIFDAIERDPGTPAEYRALVRLLLCWPLVAERFRLHLADATKRFIGQYLPYIGVEMLLSLGVIPPAKIAHALAAASRGWPPGAHITRTLPMMHDAERWIGFLERTAAATWSEATPLRISVPELHVYSDAAQEADLINKTTINAARLICC